jgi:hypothetical protein
MNLLIPTSLSDSTRWNVFKNPVSDFSVKRNDKSLFRHGIQQASFILNDSNELSKGRKKKQKISHNTPAWLEQYPLSWQQTRTTIAIQ